MSYTLFHVQFVESKRVLSRTFVYLRIAVQHMRKHQRHYEFEGDYSEMAVTRTDGEPMTDIELAKYKMLLNEYPIWPNRQE